MSKLVSCSANAYKHKVVVVCCMVGLLLTCVTASSSYADSETPQPSPPPSSSPQPVPPTHATPHPHPVTMMRYEGITSQGQPLTIWVDQGVITSISIGIQTGTYSSYTATYHGNLADVQGSTFDITLSNEKEWLHITGNVSVGTYGEPPQGTFHFIGTFSVSDYIPNTDVAGTWHIGRPALRFVPTLTPTVGNQADAFPSLGIEEHTTTAPSESTTVLPIDDTTPRVTQTPTASPTPNPTATDTPTSQPDTAATSPATPTTTNTPTPTKTEQSGTTTTPTATPTPTPSGTPSTPTPTLTPTPTSTSSSGSSGTSLSLGIKGEELAFDKDTLNVTIEQGNAITFQFTNSSRTQAHSWVMLNHNNVREAEHFVDTAMSAINTGYIPTNTTALMNTVIAYIEALQPGMSKTIQFNAPAPGEYLYICTVPGHFMAGNYGILRVNAP